MRTKTDGEDRGNKEEKGAELCRGDREKRTDQAADGLFRNETDVVKDVI